MINDCCDNCGTRITKTSNAQKYCTNCAPIIQLFKKRRNLKKKREKAGSLGAHLIKRKNGKPNFKAEAKAIKKELKRLRLRK